MKIGRSSILSMFVMLAVFSLVLTAFFLYGAREREKSRAAKCLNNMKCISQGLKMYADDYDGQLPSSYFVSRSKRWNAADSKIFCTGAGWARKRDTGWGPTRRTWPEILYEHICSPDPPFCPSESLSDRHNVPVSYYYKLANDKAWYGAGRRSMGDYAFEADQIAFYERLGRHYGDVTGLKNRVKINVSYMDTHVETIVIKNATSGDPINCAANSDGEPMYYNTGVDQNTSIEKKYTGPARLTDPTCSYDTF